MGIQFKKYHPPSRLQNHIQYFWMIEADFSHKSAHLERFIPGGCIQIGFDLEDDMYFITKSKHLTIRPKAYLEAPLKESFFIQHGKKTKTFGVLFYPGKFHNLSNFRFRESQDPIIPLEIVFGIEVIEIFEKIACAKSDLERVIIFSTFLLKALETSFYRQNIVAEFSSAIFLENNCLATKTTSNFFYSDRHIRRIFKDIVGMPPKTFTKIIRLESTLRTFINAGSSSLTNACLKHGYFDQSHFIRDFKNIVGLAPRKYLAEDHPIDSHYFGQ